MSNINFGRDSIPDLSQLSLNAMTKAVQKTATNIAKTATIIDQKITEFAKPIFKLIEAVFTSQTQSFSKASLSLALPALQKTWAKTNKFAIQNSPSSEKTNTAAPEKNKSHSLKESFASLKASMLNHIIDDIKVTPKNMAAAFVGKKSDEAIIENAFKKLEKNVANQLKNLPEISRDPDEKELIARMKLTKGIISNNPAWIKEKIATYQNDPMYKQMGDVKFLSILASSNNNLENNNIKPEDSPLNELERVALFGYTTGDYKQINPAARGNQENLDPGMKAYIQNTISAMQKLPDVEAPTHKTVETPDGEKKTIEEKGVLKRAIFSEPFPGWRAQTFQVGNTFTDSGFASATFDLQAQGQINLTMISTKNSKDVSLYSAWPGEKEILIVPGTEYIVKEINVANNGSLSVVLEPK